MKNLGSDLTNALNLGDELSTHIALTPKEQENVICESSNGKPSINKSKEWKVWVQECIMLLTVICFFACVCYLVIK